MLDYTRAAVKKTVDDFKRLGFLFTVFSNLAFIAYLVYAIIDSRSFLAVNIVLLTLSVAYFSFYLFATSCGKDLQGNKLAKKNVKQIFNIAKKCMKLYTLGVMLYGLSSAGEGASALYVIFMALQLMFFLIGVVFDCLVYIVEKQADFFLTAIKMDVDQITKPVKTVGNFFKKLSGEEVQPEPAPTKNRELLTKLVQEQKEEKEKIKLKEKFEKKQKRLEKKQKDVVDVTVISTEETPEKEVAPTEALPASFEAQPEKKKKGLFRK